MSTTQRIRWLPALPYVLAGYALRVLVGMVAVHPFVGLVKRTLGGWPRGDRMVFESGGLMLSEVLRLHGAALSSVLEQSALIVLAMLPVGMLMSSLLLSALASDTRKVSDVGSSAIRHFVPVAVLTLVQLVGAGGAMFMAFVVREASDALSVVVPLLGIVVAALVIIVTDAARTAAVHVGLDSAQSAVRGVVTLMHRPWPLCVAFTSRASAALFVTVVTVVGSVSIGVETPARAIAVVAMQQVALIALACLRASWFARAMELSATEFHRVPCSGSPSTAGGGRGLGDGGN